VVLEPPTAFLKYKSFKLIFLKNGTSLVVIVASCLSKSPYLASFVTIWILISEAHRSTWIRWNLVSTVVVCAKEITEEVMLPPV